MDVLGLDCFPSLRTINMYLMIFVEGERHHVLQQHLGATPPLILRFHPNKRHAALIVFLRSGQHCSCLYLSITRTEAFFMASNASYLDVRSTALVDLSCFVAYCLRISCCLYAIMSSSCTSSCCIELAA